MFTTLAGAAYGTLKHRSGYRDAKNTLDQGDGEELYEEITDFLDDYNKMYERTDDIWNSKYDPGISNEAQAAFGLLAVTNPGRTGKRMGQIKAVNEMDVEIDELLEKENPKEMNRMDSSVSMTDQHYQNSPSPAES